MANEAGSLGTCDRHHSLQAAVGGLLLTEELDTDLVDNQ